MKSRKSLYHKKYYGITTKNIHELSDGHRKVLNIFSKCEFEKILDVGCGDGNFSVLLKEACNAKEVYGIEISEKGVELARKNGVKVFQLDIDEEDFPFENNYFDAVFAGSVIEYLFDPDHLLEEVRKVLKDQGLFVITFPNLASLYNRVALLLGFQPFGMNVSLRYRVGHLYEVKDSKPPLPLAGNIRPFTLRSLKELLEIYNFDILSVKGASANIQEYSGLIRSFIALIDKVVSKFASISPDVIIVARVRK